jgi:hypothetical protein
MRPIRLAGPPCLVLMLLLVASAPPLSRSCSPSCASPGATGATHACVQGLTTGERDVLSRAQAAATGLAEQRGGHDVAITDRELKIIVIVLLSVIALALIF